MRKFILTLFLFGTFSVGAQELEELAIQYEKALENKKEEEAERILVEIAKMEAQRLLKLIQLGEDYYKEGNLDSAKVKFRGAINDFPDFPTSYTNQMIMDEKEKVYASIVNAHEKMVEIEPIAENYYNRGAYRIDKHQLKEAVLDFSAAVKLEPLKGQSYFARGCAYLEMHLPDSALLDFEKCIQIDSKNYTNYLNKGYALMDLKQFNKAIIEFKYANTLNTISQQMMGYSLNNIGYCYIMLKNYDLAKKYIDNSLEINPKNSFAYRNLAYMYIGLGKKKLICSSIEKSIELGFVAQFGDEILTMQKEYCK